MKLTSVPNLNKKREKERLDAITTQVADQERCDLETDDALFDIVDYVASLEARIEELEANNG